MTSAGSAQFTVIWRFYLLLLLFLLLLLLHLLLLLLLLLKRGGGEYCGSDPNKSYFLPFGLAINYVIPKNHTGDLKCKTSKKFLTIVYNISCNIICNTFIVFLFVFYTYLFFSCNPICDCWCAACSSEWCVICWATTELRECIDGQKPQRAELLRVTEEAPLLLYGSDLLFFAFYLLYFCILYFCIL